MPSVTDSAVRPALSQLDKLGESGPNKVTDFKIPSLSPSSYQQLIADPKRTFCIAGFSAGCFWRAQKHFSTVPGVVTSVVGYACNEKARELPTNAMTKKESAVQVSDSSTVGGGGGGPIEASVTGTLRRFGPLFLPPPPGTNANNSFSPQACRDSETETILVLFEEAHAAEVFLAAKELLVLHSREQTGKLTSNGSNCSGHTGGPGSSSVAPIVQAAIKRLKFASRLWVPENTMWFPRQWHPVFWAKDAKTFGGEKIPILGLTLGGFRRAAEKHQYYWAKKEAI